MGAGGEEGREKDSHNQGEAQGRGGEAQGRGAGENKCSFV